jgi:selenocysteine lyase/cysteine desulfurase
MDVTSMRALFPALRASAYLNTAAVGLASTRLAAVLTETIATWTEAGFDWERGEAAAAASRTAVARLIGASPRDVALVPSVSASAGLVAAQFLPAAAGENLIVGEQEYSSNHFPWRQLAARGYDIRLARFRQGGVVPDEIARLADDGTRLVAVSAVQSATGHRTDLPEISEIARSRGALLFVDASQSVGALDVTDDTAVADFLSFSDHKFLLNAGRGMGYLYIRRERQQDLLPLSAGWRAGAEPVRSFFGPAMTLSDTASRFDASISWLAAIGDRVCLELIHEIGPDRIHARNRTLADLLRLRLAESGVACLDPGPRGRSHIVSVPLLPQEREETAARLKAHGVVAAVRGEFIRFAVHFYNDEEDVERAVRALAPRRGPSTPLD